MSVGRVRVGWLLDVGDLPGVCGIVFECLVDFKLDYSKMIDSCLMYMGGVGQYLVFYIKCQGI